MTENARTDDSPAGTAGPEKVRSADQIGLSALEAEAAPPRDDVASWAKKVERLQVDHRDGVRGTNVAGRRLTGPVQGFGKMWQKTYRMDAGSQIEPEQAIATWKEHFPEFWPKGNRFAGALTGINPGDVALLDLAIGGGVKLSTGVFVLYADEESFTLMTPQGHMFAGWITFSAERARHGSDPDTSPRAATVVQAQVLMRANDPLYELAMSLGGHRKEDQFWVKTMTALATYLGALPTTVQTRTVCIDRRRQWGNAGHVRHNSMVRSMLHSIPAAFAQRRPSGK